MQLCRDDGDDARLWKSHARMYILRHADYITVTLTVMNTQRLPTLGIFPLPCDSAVAYATIDSIVCSFAAVWLVLFPTFPQAISEIVHILIIN